MTAQEILRLIEAVDPSDTAKLDEIDARVWCWKGGIPYFGLTKCKETYKTRFIAEDILSDGSKKTISLPIFITGHPTRSRDALKAIRPESFESWQITKGGKDCGLSVASCYSDKLHRNVLSEICSTEELAELHAIIQAIEYERNKN